ncbi:OLC1v1033397C1 [Oldenlandia corymbosa var. corymbosa]|uniref:OLC1v1033397C1 n=1 Tax=Oldenlandia corymbosa var. corymbosa TaxID=529605 RepID=A0AAV1CNV5_OLDCO|nr:OLC1v1033397C1 [Oldenlandia corymbosa var. corymbosa]
MKRRMPLPFGHPPYLLLLLLAAVVPQLLSAAAVTPGKTTSSGHAFPYPPYEHFPVRDTILATKITKLHQLHPDDHHQLDSLSDESSSLSSSPPHDLHQARGKNKNGTTALIKSKLKIFHRDKLGYSHFIDHKDRFLARMKRDAARVAAIIKQVSGGGVHKNGGVYEEEKFGTEVISGMEQGSGEYFVRIGVGSPARNQYMVIDSGSDIVWVQCQPCNLCYHQSDPVFDPSLSASFSGVSCGSFLCDKVENSGCNSGRCKYEVQYGDGSYTKGTMALETLSFGGTVVRNVAIGCGHRNRGMFVGAAGLLGLGGGSMSLVGQLGGQTGGAFSYCLVSRGTSSTGSLEFGLGALPVGAAWVPLLRNPRAPSFYYIGLSGLGVGGMQLPIPEQVFQLSELGDGGVVMDTGTAVTRLPGEAYVTFRDAFIAETANLPRAAGVSIFDTCYNLNEFVTVRVPTVSFFLSGGPILTLPARNFLIPVDERGTFCFAFAPSSTKLSIIGNIQQEGIQISFDGANEFVGFGPNVC